MDRNYIENEHIVERYLSGELTVREAREFEEFCADHPLSLKDMAIPAQVKARIARKPSEGSETGTFKVIPSSATHAALRAADEGFDAAEERWHRSDGADTRVRLTMIGLSVAVVLAAAAAAFYWFQANTLQDKLQQMQDDQRAASMQAPGSVQHYKVKLQANKPSRATLGVGFPQPPQFLELHVDVGQLKYTLFQITIDKADGTRVLQMKRIGRDSNKELRVAVNSSAFGPGDYLLRFDGINWRGQSEQVGWVRLGLQ